MKVYIRRLLRKIANIKNLYHEIENQGKFPAGHYSSPVPDKKKALAFISNKQQHNNDLVDIQLNKENQYELLNDYVDYYKDLPFPIKQSPDYRYYFDNDWFTYSDAIFLYCFLRKNTPKKIIEVGSGFSSAVILDTVDNFFSFRPDITFIEPYPDRLHSLLKNTDTRNVTIIEKYAQDVSPDIYLTMEAGDLLFIDSSHVLKCGSDLHVLMFDILPFLPSGVFVHFHDIFYPFEYPFEWIKQGRYWNENYFLRAFLSNNSEWSIYFFNTYMADMFNDVIEENMPLCLNNTGGSLYIRRS